MFKSTNILELIETDQYNLYLKQIYKLIIPIAKKVKKKYSPDFLELEDIVQETVIHFYRKVKEGKIKNLENLEGYLYIVTRNLTLNKVKTNKIITVEINEAFDGIEDDDYQKAEEIESRANLLLEALNIISESCKNMLYAYYYKEMTMKQIALEYGYSNDDVVKTKHYKCKQKLSAVINGNTNFNTLLNIS